MTRREEVTEYRRDRMTSDKKPKGAEDRLAGREQDDRATESQVTEVTGNTVTGGRVMGWQSCQGNNVAESRMTGVVGER